LDTFRDLGIAMMMALLAIYFLMVAQFKSFKIAGVIMMTFLLGLFGIMPGFSLIYILWNEFFTAPSMI
jgi:multidrug efflux pump subunit AcrB